MLAVVLRLDVRSVVVVHCGSHAGILGLSFPVLYVCHSDHPGVGQPVLLIDVLHR